MITICLSLMLAVLAAAPPAQPSAQPQSELLPTTPGDWRFERIDFPLSFAPELKYEGFEELRFAPGMFKADSETYFTYIFAMKITSEVVLDAAALQSMLEAYYRGLCRAVGKDSKFEMDLSKISAKVQTDPAGAKGAKPFRATVESFDPFVTGKPLTLNMEMIVVDAAATDHRIFAAVSPKAVDSPVWKLLRTMKDQFLGRSAQPPK